jgi:hypothetical protein
MLIAVSEKNPNTLVVKKAKASDVVNFLQPVSSTQTTGMLLAPPANPNKAHLDSMGIVHVFARTDLSEQDYKQYLDSTPPGRAARSFINGHVVVSCCCRSDGVRLGTGKEREPERTAAAACASRRCQR